MNRRTFLGALASGGAAALAGCTSRRETIQRVSATPEISSGAFYHRPLRIDERGKQFNLQYEVTADAPFDVMLFGGQSDPREFERYRELVRGTGDGEATSDDTTTSEAHHGRGGSGQQDADGAGGGNGPHGGGPGDHSRRPEPSDWHSVMGTRGRAEVNRPLRHGTHHFVVDNTAFGEATPSGTLRPMVDLSVRDFELFSG